MKNEKLSNEQISGLCMELSLLLHAGVRAGDGLALLAEESRGDDRAWLEEMARQVDDGASLAAALGGNGGILLPPVQSPCRPAQRRRQRCEAPAYPAAR